MGLAKRALLTHERKINTHAQQISALEIRDRSSMGLVSGVRLARGGWMTEGHAETRARVIRSCWTVPGVRIVQNTKP